MHRRPVARVAADENPETRWLPGRKAVRDGALALLRKDLKRRRVQAKQVYDRDVAALKRHVTETKTRLNGTVAIARLPPELFGEVFLVYVMDSWQQLPAKSHTPLPWVNILHVCHYLLARGRPAHATAMDGARLRTSGLPPVCH